MSFGQQDNIYVSFKIGDETYGLGIDDVKQIIRIPSITRVPKMPDYILGMTNLRGVVMPLTDLALKLGYGKNCDLSEDARVIVIEKEDIYSGLVVESVNEVKSTEIQNIDEFPDMLSAVVDKKYISGIMKIESDGKTTLMQILNSDEIINKDAIKALPEKDKYRKQGEKTADAQNGNINEKRYISFNIGKQEYAIEIHMINEIMWMPSVTAIPGLPSYVLGIFSIRGRVIPLLSLHEKFLLNKQQQDDSSRVIVVDINNVKVAFAADKVNAVLSVDEKLIEEPPQTFGNTEDSEVSAILKLENGSRLVMVLDTKNLVSKSELEALMQVSNQATENEAMADVHTASDTEEKQIVTFKIENEEYGIFIEKVQEINRYTNVTKVPQTPKFVEGIINLRGEVIPLIDLRTRFDLMAKERDEFTRVIIVNLNDMKVGFVVDGVDEVLRINKSEIDGVPPVLSAAVSSEFIAGVVNSEAKKGMILLLSVEDLFSQTEIKKLEKMQQE